MEIYLMKLKRSKETFLEKKETISSQNRYLGDFGRPTK